jgi:hypothetical protein
MHDPVYAHELRRVWLWDQRDNHVEANLEADREHRLQALPGWTWDPYADRWEDGFRRLLDYVKGNGHARLPATYTVDGYRLGSWVRIQRLSRKEGTLNRDRERRLKNVPGWTWDAVAARWADGLGRLVEYVNRNGHANVPKDYTVDGYQLGAWVDAQRRFRRKGTLDADRQRRLEDLPGWTWDPNAEKWEEGFSRLLKVVEQTGTARVAVSYSVDDYSLGSWVSTQRHMHARGILDADREHRLQELPGWTWRARSSP